MFTSIVFSKDRALQLDLTLNSIKSRIPCTRYEYPIHRIDVLYTTSKEHENSYETLIKEHQDVNFVRQSASIFRDIKKLVDTSLDEYVCFFTDDDIVYRDVSLTQEDIDLAFENQVSCISLRLGKNTVMRDYGDGVLRQDALPEQVGSLGNLLVWNRTSIPIGGYWAYPLSVDAHIFQKHKLLRFCNELCVLENHYSNLGVPRAKYAWKQTPNEFEAKLQMYFFDLPALMACPEYSCVVNSPNNRVQNQIKNRNGDNYSYVALDLKDEYEEGKRLSLESIDFEQIVCPHQELDILQGI